MMVRMLVNTSTPANGCVRIGDVVDVDEATCQRWIDHKIAVFVNSAPDELTNADVHDVTKSEPDEVKKTSVPKKKKAGRAKKGK